MKKLIFGIIVSIFFIYLSIRGVEYEEVFKALANIKYIFLAPAIMFFLCISFLRSLRWGIVLSPIAIIKQKRLYPITCVGYMAITLIPMRIGEFIRPYLVGNEAKIPLSSALATVIVERVADVLTVLGILFLAVFSSTLPGWLSKSGYSALLILVVLISLMLILYYKTEFTLNLFAPLLNKVPKKLSVKIEEIVRNFGTGLKIISNPKRLIYTLLLSVLIWVFSALAIYSLFLFQNLQLPLISAFVVLVITIIGITLPAAPGFIGNFQFGCIVALSIFHLPKGDALAFSMVFYFLGIGINILLGLVFLHTIRISFKDIMNKFTIEKEPL
ncbi:MAG: lysylphosphatidylglycerol synthase transmembrane domain-containing protein [Candidatus Bathyarchaeota archaeon]